MTTVAQILATNNFGDTRSGGLAGPMGLLIIVLLGIVTAMLIRHMNGRLRRLPQSFAAPDGSRPPEPAAPGATAAAAGAPTPAPVGTPPAGTAPETDRAAAGDGAPDGAAR